MPLAVWGIGFGIFAQGTSELMLAGLLPELAADLGVSIAQAGLLISAFALGMLVGAPLLAVLTLRWPRRRALLTFLVVFILSHVAGALTGSYLVLFATRFAGAFAYAGFWAVGGGAAMALVGSGRRARAMAIVAGGLTVATLVGLPAGTWIGQHFGWRGAFWAVTALSAAALVAIATTVPALRPERPPRAIAELRGLRRPRLWLSYAMTATATAALLGTFSYLAVLLTVTAGLDPAWVPAALFGYGVGAVLGIVVGGRLADRFPRAVLGLGFTGLLLASVALASTASVPLAAIALTVLLGFIGFSTNPSLSSRVVEIAPRAPTLVVSGNVAAFNVGISVGPWLGGLVISAGYGYPSVAWIGVALAALALLLWAADLTLFPQLSRRTAPVSPAGIAGRG